jgi:hypothetical protein
MADKLKLYRTISESGTNLSRLEKSQPLDEKEDDPVPNVGERGNRQVTSYTPNSVTTTCSFIDSSISLRKHKHSAKSDIKTISVESLETIGCFKEFGDFTDREHPVNYHRGTGAIQVIENPEVISNKRSVTLPFPNINVIIYLPLTDNIIATCEHVSDTMTITTTEKHQFFKGIVVELAHHTGRSFTVVVHQIINEKKFTVKIRNWVNIDKSTKNTRTFDSVRYQYNFEDTQKLCDLLNSLVEEQCKDTIDRNYTITPYEKDMLVFSDNMSNKFETVSNVLPQISPKVLEVTLDIKEYSMPALCRQLRQLLSSDEFTKQAVNEYSVTIVGRTIQISASKMVVPFKLEGHLFRLLHFKFNRNNNCYHTVERSEELLSIGSKIYVSIEGVENPYFFVPNNGGEKFSYVGEMIRFSNGLILKEPVRDLRVVPSANEIKFHFYSHTGSKMVDIEVEKIARLVFCSDF